MALIHSGSRRITTFLQGKVDRGEMPGMIATVARRGQTAYYQKFGYLDREAQTPMRDDAIFIIASMTKPVTSVALMTLYEEGHFHLNTPVYEFIPAFRDTKVFVRETAGGMELEDLREPITFRHLFTHTAGLCYGGERDAVDRLYAAQSQQLRNAAITNEKLVEELAKLPLAFQPGTHWRYSFAIDVLGRLVEVISGQSLDVFMQERLFKPLGMVDTAFYVPPEKVDRVATVYGHTAPDPELKRMDQIRPRFQPPAWFSGGGGLVSTVARLCPLCPDAGQRRHPGGRAHPRSQDRGPIQHEPGAPGGPALQFPRRRHQPPWLWLQPGHARARGRGRQRHRWLGGRVRLGWRA